MPKELNPLAFLFAKKYNCIFNIKIQLYLIIQDTIKKTNVKKYIYI